MFFSESFEFEVIDKLPVTWIRSMSAYDSNLLIGTQNEVMYSWISPSSQTSVPVTSDNILGMENYDSNLFLSTGSEANLYTYDGTNLTLLSGVGDQTQAMGLTEFNSYIYLGTYPGGKIYQWDGSTMTEVYDSSESYIFAIESYDSKIYAGVNEQIVSSSNGTSWSIETNLGGGEIRSFGTHDSNLWVGTTQGKIYTYDGTNWSLSYSSGESEILTFLSTTNYLFAGGLGEGKIFAYNGTDWVEAYDSNQTHVYASAVYDGFPYFATKNGYLITSSDVFYGAYFSLPRVATVLNEDYNGTFNLQTKIPDFDYNSTSINIKYSKSQSDGVGTTFIDEDLNSGNCSYSAGTTTCDFEWDYSDLNIGDYYFNATISSGDDTNYFSSAKISIPTVIYRPIDEHTGNPIEGNWSISISGAIIKDINNISADAYYLSVEKQTTDDFLVLNISDVNNSYYSRKYYISDYSSSSPINPFLSLISDSTSFSVSVIDSTSLLVPDAEIRVIMQGDLNSYSTSQVLEDQILDDSGYSLFSGLTLKNYDLNILLNGVEKTVVSISISSASYEIAVDSSDYDWDNDLGSSWRIEYNPNQTILSGDELEAVLYSSDFTGVNVEFEVYLTNVDSNLDYSVLVYDDNILWSGAEMTLYDSNFLTDYNFGQYDSNTFKIKVFVYDSSGLAWTSTKYYTKYIDSDSSPLQNVWDSMAIGMREEFGCQTSNLQQPCGVLLLLAVFLSFFMALGIHGVFGLFSDVSGSVFIALIPLGFFTFIGWIPMFLFVLLCIMAGMLMLSKFNGAT